MNDLERIRRRVGLSRRQMLTLLGAHPSRTRPFVQPNHLVDPIFLQRAACLEHLHQQWQASVLANARELINPFTVETASVLLGMPAMSLYLLSRRHPNIWFQSLHHTNPVMTPSDLEKLFDYCEQFFYRSNHRGNRMVRSPLANPFLRWLKRMHPDFLQNSDRPREMHPMPTTTTETANSL